MTSPAAEVIATGSASARLSWAADNEMTTEFKVFRALSNSFPGGSPLAIVANDQLSYNDYALAPSTQYFYWVLRNFNGSDSAPGTSISITTPAIVPTSEALGETQMNALYDWAYGVYQGLFPVEWKYQPMPQEIKPKIVLNVISVKRPGFNDDYRDNMESLGGARVATISVNVSSDPQPPARATIFSAQLQAAVYTLTVNSVAFSKTYSVAPANATVVAEDLLEALEAAGFTNCGTFGPDPDNQSLYLENNDPRATLTVVATTANLSASIGTLPKAMTIAQRLMGSLQDNAFTDALSAAGIGVGTVGQANDLSVMMDTRAELRAQFDFFVNLFNNRNISGPIIDEVASLDGSFN